MRKNYLSWLFLLAFVPSVDAFANEPKKTPDLIVRPKEINDVLVNPGIGFNTFQRFDGDTLNAGDTWEEGYAEGAFAPLEKNPYAEHPPSSLAYIRIYWKHIEPEPGQYDWPLIDRAIEAAKQHGQDVILRLMPYGAREKVDEDVPAWYRELTHETKDKGWKAENWRIDHENPEYTKRFGRLLREFGRRYDANPAIDAVDISFVGPWGEGQGSDVLLPKIHRVFTDLYFDNFKKTKLLVQPWDWLPTKGRKPTRPLGVRFDCLGDMGMFSPTWSHMFDFYPQAIIRSGLQNAWMKRPVSLEVCGVLQTWKDNKYDLDYIIEQSLKWHISSFNNKSARVPAEWRPKIDQWLKKMGYRLALRRFACAGEWQKGKKISFQSWWENKGVAPPYSDFRLALRLKGQGNTALLMVAQDIREWLPGDFLVDKSVQLPKDLPEGSYELELAIVDALSHEPRIKLAIAGRTAEGWYPLGKIKVIAEK